MSEAERNRLISGIIAGLQFREQKEKEAEAVRMQQYYSNIGRRTTLSDPTTKSQWYFYNPTTVSQGIGEFQVKWGRRNLEDNWRRKNKGTVEMAMNAGIVDTDEQTAGAQKIQDIYTPAYYLQNIPITDSMMLASNRVIEESLYAAGYIFNNNFDEHAMAAEQYEDLLRRYPQSDYVIPSYYYLYQLYTKLSKTAEAEKYKNLLLSKAPESVYAKIILDPTYLDKLAQQKGESEQMYEQAYNHYTRAEYRSVIDLATDALERFPKDVLTSRFAYLKAISEGKSAGTNEVMRAEMKKITTDYPGTDIAAEAQNLINFIDGEDPVMKQAEQVERAKALYTYNENEAYYFIWVVDSKENINQLSFDVQVFNVERFANIKLEFKDNNIDGVHVLLIVKGLADLQRAQAYYRTFVMDLDVMKNARYKYSFFLISVSNYAILAEDKKVEDYLEFFKKEYK
jgi:outer membrane protein assembly factor BamD (BamD/ComL family)